MDKDNRVELKPCPFCGCKELIISEYFPQENEVYTYFSKRYAIKCDYNEGGCGCESGHYKSLEEAISNWNSRSTEVCIDGGADVKQGVLDLKIVLSDVSGYHPNQYATQAKIDRAMSIIDKLSQWLK